MAVEFAEGIAVDKNGEVYVADTANDRIEVFYPEHPGRGAVLDRDSAYTLAVQSTPPTRAEHRLDRGDGGTTNYIVGGHRGWDEREPASPGD